MSTKDTSARLEDIGPYTLGLDTSRSLEHKGPKAKDMRTWRPRIHAHRDLKTLGPKGLEHERLKA